MIAIGAAACSSGPRVSDWSLNAVQHVERFHAAYLKGDARVQQREFELARSETARTGRPELVARVELNLCAVRVAALDFQPCSGFEVLRQDAELAERAYAAYLAGQTDVDVALLPPAHRAVPQQGAAAVAAIDDPLARLVAAGVVLRQGRATPALVQLAVDEASRQGWRRALLAWLGVQARAAEARGDTEEAARVRRRIDLAGQGALR